MAPAFVESASPVNYYPHGMHLVMSIAQALTPGSVPAVMNGTWILLIGVLPPLSTAVAARQVFSDHPVWRCGRDCSPRLQRPCFCSTASCLTR